jgi:hypothetical protein
VGFVGGETVYFTETCVTDGVGGTGEGSVDADDPLDIKEEFDINVEAVHIKEEMPEATSFPTLRKEPGVRLWGVGVCGCDSSCLYARARYIRSEPSNEWSLATICK